MKRHGNLRRTIDDLSIPIVLTLLHPSEEVVTRDLGTIRYLDGAGFYDVEPATPVGSAPGSTCAR